MWSQKTWLLVKEGKSCQGGTRKTTWNISDQNLISDVKSQLRRHAWALINKTGEEMGYLTVKLNTSPNDVICFKYLILRQSKTIIMQKYSATVYV